MYVRNLFILRFIALLLAFTTLLEVLTPTAAYALTSGPTAPEYSSFEPVDATDMVNLATGDFTYTLPLLEVPSPEGSYPLALSYHAGIKPDQEASWVGLGWTLNAGAINRYVSMLPDDASFTTSVVQDYWEGGTTETWGGGIGIAGMSFGITVANDTYKGVGYGGNASVSLLSYQAGPVSIGVGMQVGSDPYGNGGYTGIGLFASTTGTAVRASANVAYVKTTNGAGESNDYFTAGVGINYANDQPYGSGSILGASISSADNSKTSYSILGALSNQNNFKSGNLSISGNSIGFSIPLPTYIPTWLNFSHSFQRYYLFNFDKNFAFGSLYFNQTQNMTDQEYPKGLFDIYTLKTLTSTYKDSPNSLNGGAFPAFDSYSVNAQGIGGTIKPCLFEYATLPGGANVGERNSSLLSNGAQEYVKPVGFRFDNDFSNAFLWDIPDDFSNESSWDDFLSVNSRKVGYDATKYSQINTSNPVVGFNKERNRLSSSSHVEYYTNDEINQNQAQGLIKADNRPSSFSSLGYDLLLNNNIGAFKITNKTGVTYHFSLPLYNFEETQKIITPNNLQRTITKSMPYAYTWLLTAITGPDFVDRGIIGSLDNSDYGYWVKFNYGKWTDQAAWRTPNTGTDKDPYSGYTSYSFGKKQLYYLNTIQTRTHTALFVKDLRKDGRSVASREQGGYNAYIDDADNVTEGGVPVGTLALSRVILCENNSLVNWLASNLSVNSVEQLNMRHGTTDSYRKAVSLQTVNVQEWGNVLDAGDIAGFDLGKDVGQKQIVFNTNYDLCKETLNSFDVDEHFVKTGNLDGKLTLKSLDILGHDGLSVLPPTSFDYSSYNPVYNEDKKDIWGNYKSDWRDLYSDRVPQVCTEASSQQVEAWSLKAIHNSLGSTINIDYESDKYQLSGLISKGVYSVADIIGTSDQNEFKIYLYASEQGDKIVDLGINKSVVVNLRYMAQANSASQIIYDGEATDIPATIVGNGTEQGTPYIIINSSTMNWEIGNQIRSQKNSESEQLFLGTVEYDIEKTYDYYGGGLRVKSIGITDGERTNQTIYTYEQGITSYTPINLNVNYSKFHPDSRFLDPGNHIGPYLFEFASDYRDECRERVYPWFRDVISTSPFLPAPGVIYSKVTLTDLASESFSSAQQRHYDGEGRIEYYFTNCDDLPLVSTRQDQGLFGNAKKTLVTFVDYSNRVGLLKSVIRYTPEGTVLSSSHTDYLHDLPDASTVLKDDLRSQGVFEQLYREAKESGQRITFTKIAQAPVVQLGQITEDNKTGINLDSRNIAFDFFSGEATATLSTNASGDQFLTIIKPAYKIYDNMGLKTEVETNKNMLSQTAYSTSYKVSLEPGLSVYNVDSYNRLGLIAARANVWEGTIPRLKATYAWTGDEAQALNLDGSYPTALFQEFNGADVTQAGWQLESRIVQYDSYSHPLVSEDVNGNRSCMVMDPKAEYVSFSLSNSSPEEAAYSGVEYCKFITGTTVADGRVTYNRSDDVVEVTGINSNTGNYALRVNSGTEGFGSTISAKPNRLYETGVWVYLPGESENDLANAQLLVYQGSTLIKTITPSSLKKSGSHYFLHGTFKSSSMASDYRVVCKTASGSPRALFFDDFYVRPVDAGMSVFIYNSEGKLSHMLDQDHLYTRYEYDHADRLKTIHKQIMDVKREYLVSKTKINYGKGN